MQLNLMDLVGSTTADAVISFRIKQGVKMHLSGCQQGGIIEIEKEILGQLCLLVEQSGHLLQHEEEIQIPEIMPHLTRLLGL